MAGSRDEDGQHKWSWLKKDTLCLSDLPDEILLHILSLLPTKSVVATSLLSRRWQHLWNHIPNLELHESPIDEQRFRDSPYNLFPSPIPPFNAQFMDFAERALAVRGGSSLVSFSFACEVRDDAVRIKRLISSAISCNVEQLSLYLWDTCYQFRLPLCVFGSETLVKLDLETNGQMIRFSNWMVCLPRLKHLRLKRFFFVDDKSTENLLSHPLLEEMILLECYWDNLITAVNVNSPKLHSLAIDDFNDLSEDRQVCFLGHNLKIFCYKGKFPPDRYCISASTMQLREAQLLAQFQFPKDYAAKSYCKLIKCLSGVQNLTLSQYGVNAFNDPLHECSPKLQAIIPVFENVTRLNLTYDESIDTDGAWLRMIFEKCPHLEHLNIMTELVGGMGLKLIPSNLLINLKKITVRPFDPSCSEHDDAINVLLHSAPVLEDMVLLWREDSSSLSQSYYISELETRECKLNWRPKLSEKCRISLILEFF